MGFWEEIKVKFNVDSSGLAKAKRDIEEFSKSGHSGFVHVGSEARGFHRLMERITDASPLMGNALKLALDPVIGTIGLVTTGFIFATKAIEEFNKKLDEMRDANARPIGNPEGAITAGERATNEGIAGGRIAATPAARALSRTTAVGVGDRQALEAKRKKLAAEVEELKKEKAQYDIMKSTAEDTKKKAEESGKSIAALRETEENNENQSEMKRVWNKTPIGALLRAWALRGEGSRSADFGLKSDRQQLDDALRDRARANRAEHSVNTADFLEKDKIANQRLTAKSTELGAVEEELRFTPGFFGAPNLNRAPFRRDKFGNIIRPSGFGEFARPGAQTVAGLMHPFSRIAPRSPGPTIDPLTGGITARDIADQGGVGYNAIKGAPGYVPPGSNAAKAQTAQQKTDAIMDAILTHLHTGGIPVKGSD